ncbi:hypothetical protein C922_05666 [Plasmodium inui San Antonio 1]|uniref:Uncharacterized protein n=1 Tax=Plasmodium inui San Antonio 1 TaxID=1237626 RepID=W6ZXB6_9APIC|nr:hypothetical protein C922_05666 [Plasmodium inui San Antonio 1]EUD63953.1 hypothetical protein C922_05666 [Plasmodium inui San Antonio 1]
MQSALNVGWRLDDWGKHHKSWGYANSSSGNCSTTNRIPYCYPSLLKKGNSRWEGLNEWLNKVLIEPETGIWGREFDPNIESGVKDNDQNSLTWGQLLDKIIDKLQSNQLVGTPKEQRKWIWTGPEWYTVLTENGIETKDWEKTEHGKKLLIVVVCIVTGLIDSMSEGGSSYPNRCSMCQSVDKGLMNSRNQWKSWFSRGSSAAETSTSECKPDNVRETCGEAAMSLIITVYKALSALCPNCGNYYIDPWVRDSHEEILNHNWYYCRIHQANLSCDKCPRPTTEKDILWMRPHEELRRRKQCHSSSKSQGSELGASKSHEMNQDEAGGEKVNKQEEHTKPKSPLSEMSVSKAERNLTGESLVSNVSKSGGQGRDKVEVSQSRSPRGAPKSGRDLAKTETGYPSNQRGNNTTEWQKGDHGVSGFRGGSEQKMVPESGGKQGPSSSEEGGAFVPSIVAGIFGVVLLGVAGAYGIFRIWGPQRGRGKAKRVIRKIEKVSYGVTKGSEQDRINISVLPIPA